MRGTHFATLLGLSTGLLALAPATAQYPTQHYPSAQQYSAPPQYAPQPQYAQPQYGNAQHTATQYPVSQHAGTQYPQPQYAPRRPAPQYAAPQPTAVTYGPAGRQADPAQRYFEAIRRGTDGPTVAVPQAGTASHAPLQAQPVSQQQPYANPYPATHSPAGAVPHNQFGLVPFPARYVQRDDDPPASSALVPPMNPTPMRPSPSDVNPMHTQPMPPQLPMRRPAAPSAPATAQPMAPSFDLLIPPSHHAGYYNKGAEYGAHGYGCGSVGSCCPPPARSPWYGKVGALLLTRDNENEVWYSYDTNDITSQIVGSLDAHMGWRLGYDVRIGKYYEEGLSSIEGVYFGMISDVSEFNAYGSDMAGNLDATLAFDSLEHDSGGGLVAVSTYFNNAERHQLLRSHEVHNVELNHWRHMVTGKCAPKARISWMCGFRYFNFSEGFRFRSDPNDTVFGNQADDGVYYDVDMKSHMLGFQIGGMGEFCVAKRWQLNSTVKLGLFANHMIHSSWLGCDNSAATVNNAGSPYHGLQFNVQSTKDDVSLLGEIDLGGRYQLNDCWNLTAGYRAIGVTGIGLATNQVPAYFANIGGVRHIDGNGSLILHGVYYVGAEYNY